MIFANELLIHTNSSADITAQQGVDFRYDSKTKELSVFIGKMGKSFDDETEQELISEKLILHYHPDSTMDVVHLSEDNLTGEQKAELIDYSDRVLAVRLKYGENVPAISIDKLFDESDLLDELDSSYFEDLHRRFKFQAPEFDVDIERENDSER